MNANPIRGGGRAGAEDQSDPRRKRLVRELLSPGLLVEAGIYGLFVTAYFLLVLHAAGGMLRELYDQHRTWYALLALLLIVIQGAGLESLTRALVGMLRRRA